MTTIKMTNAKALQYVLSNCEVPADVQEKIEKMLAQLEKKSSVDRKPTATQVANEALGNEILSFLRENGKKTVSEMIKEIPACGELSNQKVSAIVRTLSKEGKVQRVEEKRKAYFEAC